MKTKFNSLNTFKIFCLSLLALTSSCSSLKLNNTHGQNNKPSLNFFAQNELPSNEKKPKEYWNLESPPSLEEIKTAVKNDQVNHKVKDLGEWWLYGPGIGRTALNIGTVIVFPPYALYLLANAGLSLAGYSQLSVLEALPPEPKAIAQSTYDSITQVPGRLNSLAAGKEYFNSNINVSELAAKTK